MNLELMGIVRHFVTIAAGAVGFDAIANGDTITAAAAGVVAIGVILVSVLKRKLFGA